MIIAVSIDNDLNRRLTQRTEAITTRAIARRSPTAPIGRDRSIVPASADLPPASRTIGTSPIPDTTGEP